MFSASTHNDSLINKGYSMLKKSIFLAALTAAALAAPVASVNAETIPGSQFGSGNWKGNAFATDKGFTHCAISASYRSGISLHFAIDRRYKWRIGFSNRQWEMRKGGSFAIRYQVDRHEIISANAAVISPTFVMAELVATKAIFNQFRNGQTLRVEAGGKVYPFRLTGTSEALRTVLACVDRYVNYAPPSASKSFGPAGTEAPQSKSFGPDSVAIDNSNTSRVFSTTPEDLSVASDFAKDLFSASEYADYKLVQHDALAQAKGSKFIQAAAVGWKGSDATGTLHVLNIGANRSADVLGKMIANDSKHCKGKFASGTQRSEHDARIHVAFTACQQEGTYKFYVDYIVFPKEAGKLYLISHTQANRQEIDRTKADTFSRNVAYVIQ